MPTSAAIKTVLFRTNKYSERMPNNCLLTPFSPTNLFIYLFIYLGGGGGAIEFDFYRMYAVSLEQIAVCTHKVKLDLSTTR